MSESIDTWAREQVGKIWGDLRALHMDWWGPDQTNGKRSDLVLIEDRVESLEKWKNHYIDAERKGTCLGIKALEEHIKDHEQNVEEEVAVRVAGIQAGAQKGVAKWQGIVMIIGQFLTLAGLLFVAFK